MHTVLEFGVSEFFSTTLVKLAFYVGSCGISASAGYVVGVTW